MDIIEGRTPEDRLELAAAYARVFTAHAGMKDCQVVLADIMAFSGFFNICPVDQDVKTHEGKRSVGGRIFSMITMSEDEQVALFQAARKSSLIDQREGEI